MHKSRKMSLKKETASGCREGGKQKNYAGQGSLQADRYQDGSYLHHERAG